MGWVSEDGVLYVLEGTVEFILDDPTTWHSAGPGTVVHVPAGAIDHIDQADLGAVMALAQRHGMRFDREPRPRPESMAP